MTYFEFMLAFCGENRIDKTDFEKTMQNLMDRNGVHASLYEYFDTTVTDNLSLIITDTITIQKKNTKDICSLKGSDCTLLSNLTASITLQQNC